MRDLGARLQALTPHRILLLGGLGFLAYAFPGFMSYDSITQLRESRSGYHIDGHPPAMAELWRFVELFVAGPVGMLLIQSACFLVGAYLVCTCYLTARKAAVTASLLLWFPPIAAVMAVIWKDAQMTGFLVLGLGLILQDSRRMRLLGLLAFVAATAMRHNALVMTGPLIFLCFVWDARAGRIKRYVISFVAFVVVTLSAQGITSALTDEQQHIWHTSLALCDMTATLHYTTTIPEAELATMLDGVRVRQPRDLQAFIRDGIHDDDYINTLWKTTYSVFGLPRTQAEREAVTRAWKRVVFGHKDAYLAYRWEIYRRMLGLGDEPDASPVYNWFSDIQDPYYSASRADHDAYPAHFQDLLRRTIHVVGVTPMFHVILYAILTVVLLPFGLRDHRAFALLASGITSEGVLFILAPTTDWRYSFWMIVVVAFSLVMLVAGRAQRKAAA